MIRCGACDADVLLPVATCPRCGAALPRASASADHSPLIIDARYLCEAILGRGSMGVVYLAKDIGLDRRCAVKIFSSEFAKDPSLLQRFRREAALLASVRNEHVVQVFTFGPCEDTYFFAMEYVPGKTLETVLQKHADSHSRLGTHQAVALLRQLASGLQSVHAAGIIHRDFKPGNVVLEHESGRPVLIDFGLARATGGRRARNSVQAGTPAYIAPEQVLGETGPGISEKTDQYSFGCTAFEVLTGKLPFEVDDPYEMIRHHLEVAPPLVSSIRPELARFDPIVARAMAKKPDDRYPTIAEMASDIERVGGPWFKSDAKAVIEEPHAPRGTRVLVVSGDEGFNKIASRSAQLAFLGASLSTSTAGTTEDAIANASKVPPQLVLLQHKPPAIDAAMLLTALSAMRPSTPPKVLCVCPEGDRTRFAALGSVETLPEPVTLFALAQSVEKLAAAQGWLAARSPTSEDS